MAESTYYGENYQFIATNGSDMYEGLEDCDDFDVENLYSIIYFYVIRSKIFILNFKLKSFKSKIKSYTSLKCKPIQNIKSPQL